MLSIPAIRQFTVILLALPTIMLSGCLNFPFIKNFQRHLQDGYGEEDSHSNIKITSLRIPQKGERVEIIDPDSQKVYSVTLGEVFTAASGKICSNFTINEDISNERTHGLACLNKDQEWDKNPLDIKIISN